MPLPVLTPDAEIEDARRSIDRVDEAIVAFIRRRLEYSIAIARRKAELGIPIHDPARERLVVERVADEPARSVYRAVVEACRCAGQRDAADRAANSARR